VNESERKKFDEAIARGAGVVLSVPVGTALRHHKSRLLGRRDDGFLVQSVSGYDDLIAELIAQQQSLGLSFRGDQVKIVCAAIPKAIETFTRPNEPDPIKALLLDFPARMQAVQRRGSHRVRIGQHDEVSLRIWRLMPKAYLRDRPSPEQEIAAEMRDISTGGLGVILRGVEGEPPKIDPADRLRIELHHLDVTLLLEGHLRGAGKFLQPDTLQSGIQFRLQSNQIADRQKVAQLTRIIGKLQREEIRRIRLGLSA
jgi:c-di-GMP-binding flagellar brake protein YcgR